MSLWHKKWHVAWLAEWHNYAECNICRITQRNKLNWKVRPFLASIRLIVVIAFSAQLQRFFLPLLVGLHGSTHTTARKSSIEEKIFWKVTLPSTLIFLQKMFARLTLQFPFTSICICNRVRSVSFSDGGLRDHDIQRWNWSCILFPLTAWLSFRHSKLTAGGEGWDFNS